jgi:diaminopimelate decarboxylase
MIPERVRSAVEQISLGISGPFYVVDLDAIREEFISQSTAWRCFFPHFRSAYSYKTNSLQMITAMLREEGASAEVVSGMELEWALADGFPTHSIMFDGPVKMPDELHRALELGVRIQIDSLDELNCVIDLCRQHCWEPILSARLATSYQGRRLSRFGLSPDEYRQAENRAIEAGFTFRGIHFHVGSNVNSPKTYLTALELFRDPIRSLLGNSSGSFWIDIGGGFPSQSIGKSISPTSSRSFAEHMAGLFDKLRLDRDSFEFVIEPGRSLVEDHGYLVTRVVARKKRDGNNILVVDAGLHLARSVGSWYHSVEFLTRRSSGDTTSRLYHIYGCNCFESDQFAANLPGPVEVGINDLLIVGAVGGYDIPGANVWTRPSPSIFGVLKDGRVVEVRRQQTWPEVRDLQRSWSDAIGAMNQSNTHQVGPPQCDPRRSTLRLPTG